jgi:hypothetical protein
MGLSAVGHGVGRPSREAAMVWSPGQSRQLPGRRVHGLCFPPRSCFTRLPIIPTQDWARDPQRRQECHVPQEVQYQTRHYQCVEMLDEWGEQVPHGWVTGDDELEKPGRATGEMAGVSTGSRSAGYQKSIGHGSTESEDGESEKNEYVQ